MESNALLSPPAQIESRLGRAAELAEYLRQNPKDARRDPDELGNRFGLSPAMVAQIQSSVNARTSAPARNRKSLADHLKTISAALLKFAERSVSKPYVFLSVQAIVTVLFGTYWPDGAKLAAVVWCAMLAWCMLFNPRFRNAVFGSVLVMGVAGWLFFQKMRHEEAPKPLTMGEVAILFGVSMAVLNLMLGGILVVLGGSIQIAAQRRRSASLSRQDLVMRMFELQQQLATLPVKAQKAIPPGIIFARQRIFLVALIAVFLVDTAAFANALLFHVDLFAFAQAGQAQQAHPSKSGIVVVSGGPNSGPFLMIEGMLGLLSTATHICVGFLANTWRKVWLAAAGMFCGFVLVTAWALPAHAYGSMPLMLTLAHPFQDALSALCVVLVVRFAVGFNRALTTYRAGAAPDEATIVGELLDIRHRLSANPATICVLVVDAAGSTGMKKVEDNLRVEYSFGRYQNWIGQIVAAHGGKVEIRTGDGAICAFGSAELALDAARKIQTDVVRFNSEENKLDLPFRLRVALHAGLVQAELDKVQFTEVIDVAAHTEKHSPIGGIALTEAFIRALPSSPDLPVCATVDGFEVRAMAG